MIFPIFSSFRGLAAAIVSLALAQSSAADEITGKPWWAFQPLTEPTPPTVDEESETRIDANVGAAFGSSHAIDRFVHHRLRAAGLRPAPPADRETLLRRVYFNLIGVPPTPEEIQAFVDDEASNAWESVIDRLLADPRYGEHWARFWLDLVRYSESDGWNQDAYRPYVWRYRDYVVQSFNDDKPYAEFVREQLAGDELDSDNPRHLTAAGFLRLGIYEYNQRDARGHWNDVLNEMTDVAGDVFLGMSVGCARCHDHKFDPIPQVDYFKLRAFFEGVVWRDDLVAATTAEQKAHAAKMERWSRETREIRDRIQTLLKPYNDRKWKSTVDKFPLDIQACFTKPVEMRNSWEHQMAYLVSRQFLEEGGGPLKSLSKKDKEQHEALKKELGAFDALKPKPLPPMMTATDFSGPIAPTSPPGKSPTEPGFLTALPPLSLPSPEVRANTSGRRARLAAWIGHSENPLTTRVIVNRIWKQHFGRGLVATPSNFGRTGQRPSHPELLDWLTVKFLEDGWRLKPLHKRILMSSTWRQSSVHPDAARHESRDPSESLLWRAPVRRLNAEQIRDAMLAVSGELTPELGGPSVDEKAPRRALYVKRFRNRTETFLHCFDATAGLKSVASRNTTTTPTQALLLFNGNYAIERARQLASRLNGDCATLAARVRRAFLLTWGRQPSTAELESARNFLADGDEQALADFCHVLFNSNEFLYVD